MKIIAAQSKDQFLCEVTREELQNIAGARAYPRQEFGLGTVIEVSAMFAYLEVIAKHNRKLKQHQKELHELADSLTVPIEFVNPPEPIKYES